MAVTLYWMQGGGCGGDSMALLNAETPDLIELLRGLDVDVLWHPSLSNGSPKKHADLLRAIASGEQRLDVLCVEGSIVRGPGGTGMYDTHAGEPRKHLTHRLAQKAGAVVAVGTCASFGGIGTDGEIEATGLQFHKGRQGGFLGAAFRSVAGLPVINLAGCPCHPDVVCGALTALVQQVPLDLDEYQRPLAWYGMQVHQGCVRNEYHEYRIEESALGKRGCLFFHLGCQGPLTRGPCNKLRWNRRSSKTAVGVPCFGCTSPSFPRPNPFFESRCIADVPLDLPEGVDRAHYLAYKGMAAAAAPDRLRQRKNRI